MGTNTFNAYYLVENLMDGVQELDLVRQHRDVPLHAALRLVEGVGVDDDQLLQLGLLLLLKSQSLVELVLEGPEEERRKLRKTSVDGAGVV